MYSPSLFYIHDCIWCISFMFYIEHWEEKSEGWAMKAMTDERWAILVHTEEERTNEEGKSSRENTKGWQIIFHLTVICQENMAQGKIQCSPYFILNILSSTLNTPKIITRNLSFFLVERSEFGVAMFSFQFSPQSPFIRFYLSYFLCNSQGLLNDQVNGH